MDSINEKFLEEVGLSSLPADEKTRLLDYCYEMLEMRIGTRLTDLMTDAQLNNFEAMADAQTDGDSVLAWIKASFPNYDELAAEELEKIKAEIRLAYAPGSQAGEPAAAKAGDLFKQLGLKKLSRQEKLDLSEDLGGVAMNRVADRLESLLTPEQVHEFETMLQTDEPKAFELLETFVPQYSAIVAEEIEQVRAEVTTTQAEVMKRLSGQQ